MRLGANETAETDSGPIAHRRWKRRDREGIRERKVELTQGKPVVTECDSFYPQTPHDIDRVNAVGQRCKDFLQAELVDLPVNDAQTDASCRLPESKKKLQRDWGTLRKKAKTLRF